MIAVLFWVASRENSAPVAALPTSSPLPGEQEGVVLLPIVSGQSTTEPQAEIPAECPPKLRLPWRQPPTGASDGQDSQSATASAPITIWRSSLHKPIQSHPFKLWSRPALPHPRRPWVHAQTVTATPTNQTPSPITTGEVGTLFIRNDQGCVDPRNNDLYIFGEIVNNGRVPVDILNWDVKIYDGTREIQTDDIFLDIPNNYAVFANSSIPFALLTTLDRPTFTDYDISLDYAAGPHSPRSDLSIVEFTSTRDAGFTEVTGKWAHTDVDNPPDIVWIIATVRDAQGKLTNLQYQHYTNASIIDPRLPSGQHSFRQLYLEDNPCGGGTIAVSILANSCPVDRIIIF